MIAPIVEADHHKNLQILIVDDMLFMRLFFRGCLQLNFPSCNCEEVGTGKAAINKMQNNSYSIILCDWNLPDINGDEILKWVRTESTMKTIPFIMVTANDSKEGITKAIGLGVTDYVVKPVNCELLTSKIRNALKPK